MEITAERGSSRLREAWKHRVLTDESVEEIAGALDESKAHTEEVTFLGGEEPTGVVLNLAYEGDDVPWCGNDLLFWLNWHRKHGSGGYTIPKILINGIINPEILRMQLVFGAGPATGPAEIPQQQLGLGR